ncbi:MAG: cytochrome C, partial [Odoribacter sp.]|nr:cytochrome C [Odoribacter sp.]
IIIYRNNDNPIADSLLTATRPRTMDCIDCHNRPSHNYNSPPVYFDKTLLNGTVSKDIPFIKKVAMDILKQSFNDRDTALMMIKDSIINYYKSLHNDFYLKNTGLIDNSIASIQKSFAENTFPRMKVTYDRYPEHIGHLESEGCFRCHNDAFKSERGRTITRDCNLCHTIVGQGKPGAMQLTNVRNTLEFIHPVDIGTVWKEANCSECHKFLY